MWTHYGRKGLYWRDGSTIDPILNRNRKWHAVRRTAEQGPSGITFRALCGVILVSTDDETSWSDQVLPRETATGWRITCQRCRRKEAPCSLT